MDCELVVSCVGSDSELAASRPWKALDSQASYQSPMAEGKINCYSLPALYYNCAIVCAFDSLLGPGNQPRTLGSLTTAAESVSGK